MENMPSAVKKLFIELTCYLFGALEMKKNTVRESSFLIMDCVKVVGSSVANITNKEKKLSRLKKKVSSFSTGLWFFSPAEVRDKQPNVQK